MHNLTVKSYFSIRLVASVLLQPGNCFTVTLYAIHLKPAASELIATCTSNLPEKIYSQELEACLSQPQLLVCDIAGSAETAAVISCQGDKDKVERLAECLVDCLAEFRCSWL